MKRENFIFVLAAFLCVACGEYVPKEQPSSPASGREAFFSDSLNARFLYRTYPVPDVAPTPAPRGYKPVYISSYARHGSRKLLDYNGTSFARAILENADTLGLLTPLGRDVYGKIIRIDDDLHESRSDLTSAGFEQHRGIAERMYGNYRNVFDHKNVPVRFYSTNTQRTMMSMFACNQRLLELNPTMRSSNRASWDMVYLNRLPDMPPGRKSDFSMVSFIKENIDPKPLLGRIFTEEKAFPEDAVGFLNNLYHCASIAPGLDLEDVDYLWELFTYEEIYPFACAVSYHHYMLNSNSPVVGDYSSSAMSPLLKDIMDRADAALEQKLPGADLRYGHDTNLMSLLTLLGVGGRIPVEEDPFKAIDYFQDFSMTPMAGNLQFVFFRNRKGDVLVKTLLHERETTLPIETDMYPYYHWSDVREYFISLIDMDFLQHFIDRNGE